MVRQLAELKRVALDRTLHVLSSEETRSRNSTHSAGRVGITLRWIAGIEAHLVFPVESHGTEALSSTGCIDPNCSVAIGVDLLRHEARARPAIDGRTILLLRHSDH